MISPKPIGYIGKSSLSLMREGKLGAISLTPEPPSVEYVAVYAEEEAGYLASKVQDLENALRMAAEELDMIFCVPNVTETTDVYENFQKAKYFAGRGASRAWSYLKK